MGVHACARYLPHERGREGASKDGWAGTEPALEEWIDAGGADSMTRTRRGHGVFRSSFSAGQTGRSALWNNLTVQAEAVWG
jgi:hypothetical protein